MPNPFFSPSVLSSLSLGDDSYGSSRLPKHRSLAEIEAEAAKTPPADTSWHPLDAVKKGWNSLQAAEDKYITPITTKVDQATTDIGQKVGQGLKETMLPTDRWSDVIAGPMQVARHPIDSAKLVGSSLWDAQKAQFDKAATDPTYLEKAGHYAAGVLPIVGPMAAQAGETIGRGEFARGAGQVAGILGPMALGAKGAAGRAAGAADAARATEAARVRTGALKPPGIREKLGLQPVDPVGPVQGPQPPMLGPEPPMLGPVPPPKPRVVKAAPAVPPPDPSAIGPVGPITSTTQPITPAPQATRAPVPAAPPAPNFRRVKTAGPVPDYRLANDELNPKLDGATVRQLRAAGFPDTDISEMGKTEAAYHLKNQTQFQPPAGPVAAPIGNVDPVVALRDKLAASLGKNKAQRAAAPVPEIPEEEAPAPITGLQTTQTPQGPVMSPKVPAMGVAGRRYASLSDADLALLAKIDDPVALKEIATRKGVAPEPPAPTGGAGPFVEGEPVSKPVLPSPEAPVPAAKTGLLDQLKNAYNKSKLGSERGSIKLAPDELGPPKPPDVSAQADHAWTSEMLDMGFPHDEIATAKAESIKHGIDYTRSEDLYDLEQYMQGHDPYGNMSPETESSLRKAGIITDKSPWADHPGMRETAGLSPAEEQARETAMRAEGAKGNADIIRRNQAGAAARPSIGTSEKGAVNLSDMIDAGRSAIGKVMPASRDFYAPSKSPGIIGKIRRSFHGTVNPEFDANFADLVNSRKAARAEGMIRQKSFSDMNTLGTDGIDAFMRGLDQGRFKDVHDYFKAKEIQLNSLGVDTKKANFEQLLKDYEKTIETEGATPKFNNIGDMLGHYETRINRAIADHQFITKEKAAGRILPEGKAPKGWDTLSQEKYFPVEKFRQRKTGEVYTKNLQAPPEVARAINNYLNPGDPLWDTLARGAGWTKNLVLSAGVPGTGINAHGANMLVANMMAKGILRGGAEGVKYLVNTGADNPISKGIAKVAPWESASDVMAKNLSKVPDAIKHGLQVSTEDHTFGQKGGSAHLVQVGDARPTKGTNVIGRGINKVTGVVGKAADKTIEQQGRFFEDPLFQNAGPAMKMKHWLDLTDDFMKHGMDETTAKRNAASATNENYGGINWEAMQRSRSWQNFARSVILAPDWLESRYRMGKGIKNALLDPTNPQGKMYKRAIFNLTAAYMSANAVNKGISGHYMWDNEPGHGMDIEAGEVGGKTRYIRPFGTAADFARLPIDAAMGVARGDLSAPVKIAKNRLSTIARPIGDVLFNTDPFGNPIGGPDKFGRPQSVPQQLGQFGREVGSAVLPQYIKGPLDLATGRAGSVEEAALGSLEAPVRYSRKSTRPVSRRPPTGPAARRQPQAPQ